MLFHGLLGREGLPACGTRKPVLVIMLFAVFFQLPRPSEGFPASATGERLLTAMHSEMFHQVPPALENLLA